jgi:hypothetical protein
MRLGRQTMRRVAAGLLALTLLLMPGVPLRHAAAAPGAAPAAHHCETDAAAPADHAGHAAPAVLSDAAFDQGQPPGGTTGTPTGTHDTGGMACCAAAQCPAAVAVPPSTLAAPLPPVAPVVAGLAAAHQLTGIPVDPGLRPPRPPA